MTGLGTIEFQSVLNVDTGETLAVNILTADPFVTISALMIETMHVNGGVMEGAAGTKMRLENVPDTADWYPYPWGWRDQFLGALLYIECTDRTVIYRLGQLYHAQHGRADPELVIDGHWPD